MWYSSRNVVYRPPIVPKQYMPPGYETGSRILNSILLGIKLRRYSVANLADERSFPIMFYKNYDSCMSGLLSRDLAGKVYGVAAQAAQIKTRCVFGFKDWSTLLYNMCGAERWRFFLLSALRRSRVRGSNRITLCNLKSWILST